MWKKRLVVSICFVFLGLPSCTAEESDVVKVGMVGLDTSHVIAFTRILNDPDHPDHVPGVRVVAGVKGGSPDIPSSADRVDQYTQQLQDDWDIEIVDTVEDLCEKVDGVMIESVDGRPHLEYAKVVIDAGLPMFIDKPIAGSYEDVLKIAQLAHKAGVPWFGGSSLRWWDGLQNAIDPENVGDILGCETFSPCSYEPHHPDLFWYGVHGVNPLFAIMGKGCVKVSRIHTEDYDLVVGVWDDGRIGAYRGMRKGPHKYGATIYGTQGRTTVEGHSYKGLIKQIVTFFQTKESPMDPEEIVEMYAFMEAADESKELGGKAVSLPEFKLE